MGGRKLNETPRRGRDVDDAQILTIESSGFQWRCTVLVRADYSWILSATSSSGGGHYPNLLVRSVTRVGRAGDGTEMDRPEPDSSRISSMLCAKMGIEEVVRWGSRDEFLCPLRIVRSSGK